LFHSRLLRWRACACLCPPDSSASPCGAALRAARQRSCGRAATCRAVLRRWHWAAQVGLSFRSMPALFDKTKFEVRLLILFTALYRPCTGLVPALYEQAKQLTTSVLTWGHSGHSHGVLWAPSELVGRASTRQSPPGTAGVCRQSWSLVGGLGLRICRRRCGFSGWRRTRTARRRTA
jgi:hypothetical protein